MHNLNRIKHKQLHLNLPNHDASSYDKAIGSDLLVRLWKVIAGKPNPMPDDKIEKFASTLIDSWNKETKQN